MMDTVPSFETLLNESPTEVREFTLLPPGPYLVSVGMPRQETPVGKTPYIEFPCTVLQAGDEVDADDLSEAIGDEALTEQEFRIRFYGTAKALPRLDKFHQCCGIDLEHDGGRTRLQRCEDVVNREVIALVKHRPSNQDSKRVFYDFDFLPAS